jgi:uncharacterized membrane protein
MIRVPRILPTRLAPNLGANDDELTRLEAHRDQLRSLIRSEERTAADLIFWLRLVMLVGMAAFGLLLFLADKISATCLVWAAMIVSALIFALTSRVYIFEEPYHIGVLVLCLLSGLGGDAAVGIVPTPTRPSARDLLTDCESKITRLKDNRS